MPKLTFPLGVLPQWLAELNEQIRTETDPIWKQEKIEMKRFKLDPEKSRYAFKEDDGTLSFDSWQCLTDLAGSVEKMHAWLEGLP